MTVNRDNNKKGYAVPVGSMFTKVLMHALSLGYGQSVIDIKIQPLSCYLCMQKHIIWTDHFYNPNVLTLVDELVFVKIPIIEKYDSYFTERLNNA